MATRRFVVEGDLYFAIHGRVLEMFRQLRLKGGSPLNPHRLARALQALIQGPGERPLKREMLGVVHGDFDDHPLRFAYPMLQIGFAPDPLNPEGEIWDVDVGGEVGLFIVGGEKSFPAHLMGISMSFRDLLLAANRLADATPLMRRMIARFGEVGRTVEAIGMQGQGSGPSHIFRDGAFFRRVGIDTQVLEF